MISFTLCAALKCPEKYEKATSFVPEISIASYQFITDVTTHEIGYFSLNFFYVKLIYSVFIILNI